MCLLPQQLLIYPPALFQASKHPLLMISLMASSKYNPMPALPSVQTVLIIYAMAISRNRAPHRFFQRSH